jgi:hypothetical protein
LEGLTILPGATKLIVVSFRAKSVSSRLLASVESDATDPLLTSARPAAPAADSTHISLSIPAHLVRRPSSESRIGDQEWKMLAIAG